MQSFLLHLILVILAVACLAVAALAIVFLSVLAVAVLVAAVVLHKLGLDRRLIAFASRSRRTSKRFKVRVDDLDVPITAVWTIDEPPQTPGGRPRPEPRRPRPRLGPD